MTDEELRQYLKPRHNWGAIIGVCIAVLTAAAAVGKWIWTAPTDSQFRDHENRIKAQEIDGAVFKQSVDGLRKDVADQKQDLHEVKVDLRALLERRR